MISKTTVVTACTALLSIASAAPLIASTPYHGVSVTCNTANAGQPAVDEPWPAEIAELAVGMGECSTLTLDPSIATNGVDINKVQCRAYKDEYGLVPASGGFDVKNPASLSATPIEIQSIVCYIFE